MDASDNFGKVGINFQLTVPFLNLSSNALFM